MAVAGFWVGRSLIAAGCRCFFPSGARPFLFVDYSIDRGHCPATVPRGTYGYTLAAESDNSDSPAAHRQFDLNVPITRSIVAGEIACAP
jgi:hypothetical protein